MTPSRYTLTARILHWAMAALVISQIGLGLWADRAARPLSRMLVDHHVRVGLLILALVILRIAWRLAHPPPPLPGSIGRTQRRIAATVHRMLYALMLLLPVSGYILWAWSGQRISWYGLFDVPILFTGGDDETWRSIAGYTHEYAAYAIIALIVVHVGAALWHEFVVRDRLICDRMV
jgi:cytochrome b561